MSEKNIYEYFDIPEDATEEEIKQAYRDKAKDTHTDREDGGDRKEFEKATNFYRILLNPGKRRRYDDVGDVEDNADIISLHLLISLFQSYLDFPSYNIKEDNILEIIKDDIKSEKIPNLEMEVRALKSTIEGLREKIVKLEFMKERIIYNGKTNIFLNVIEANIKAIKNDDIKGIKKGIANRNEKIEGWKEGLNLLKEYKYRGASGFFSVSSNRKSKVIDVVIPDKDYDDMNDAEKRAFQLRAVKARDDSYDYKKSFFEYFTR